MILFNNINGHIFLLLVTCQIIEGNALSSFFSNFNSVISDSKGWISNLYRKVEISMPSFSSFTSIYYKKLNTFTSIADEVTKNFIGSFKTLIHNSEEFVAYISKNSSLWHCWHLKLFQSNLYSAFNVTDFEILIRHELYGQHLVHLSINILEMHIQQDNPLKPLILSFHGPTGSGKSFVSKMIAESLYRSGYKSECVHVYHGNLDFPHENKKEIYQKKLLKELSVFTCICERSLLIFDDIDKMVPGVIDVLLPWVVFNEKGSEIDIRKCILIFISQTGARKIEEIFYYSWLDGVSREDMGIEEFSAYLKEIAYNAPSGLQYSELLKKNLIDVFVPFLPLEREHIKQCIVKELKLRQLQHSMDVVDQVANQFDYDPPQFPLFSTSGCKKVSNKVDLYANNI